VLSLELQDEYSPLNLTPSAPSSGQGSEPPSSPSIDSEEAGEVDVLRMVAECFNKYDNVNLGGSDTNPSMHDGFDVEFNEMAPVWDDAFTPSHDEGSENGMEDNNDPMESSGTTMNIKDPSGIVLDVLLREARTPLYAGSSSNRLASILMVLNCCTTFGVSNSFVDELLKLLHESILPKGNTLPKTFHEAKGLLMKLGLSYNTIHACRDGCCLFRKELEDATECPICHKSRYVDNSKSVPVKVLRHFPLIPRWSSDILEPPTHG
jgi:hypothetical protein